MTTPEQHPITPELLNQWIKDWVTKTHNPATLDKETYITTQAARYGADQELEACCNWVEREIGHGREWGAELRATRRIGGTS